LEKLFININIDVPHLQEDMSQMKKHSCLFFLALAVCAFSTFITAPAHGASLKGSTSAMKCQNQEAAKQNLSRIIDDDTLERMKTEKDLVALPVNAHLRIDSGLAPKYRYCRPWTANFLQDLARDYFAKFKQPLQVNSAVRTVARQRELRKTNLNAARADGPVASSHLTGATVDIAKKDCSPEGLKWLREKLLALEKAGMVEATEENQQAVFHVMVYRSYRALPAKR
jgi:hypothetical protein